MAVIEIAKIQVRRGQENVTGIPQLAPGEFGWAQDTENLYIGKRIAEGAATDENSRILTQKDYDNLFAIVNGKGQQAVATTSTYRYRDDVDYAELPSTTTTIANKLDISVSLVDFGVETSSTFQDIYTEINLAIQSIFANVAREDDTRRRLLIPAGNYTVSSTVELPPNTVLVGEGPGLTTLVSDSNLIPIFVTVDADGNSYDDTMESNGKESKNILIEGLTLAYSSGTNTPAAPLISLDNSSESTLRNVNFTTLGLFTNTEFGTALRLRGQRRSGVEQSRNTTIENCNFNHLGIAIEATGTVVNPKIKNCVFYNLDQGINFSSYFGDIDQPAPSNAVVADSTFENIYKEAIFVSTSTNNEGLPNRVNHISQNNYFKRVGNGSALTDGLTSNSSATAVLTFFGEGCRSISDEFSRREFANPFTNASFGSFFYNPLLRGIGSLEGSGVNQLSGFGTGTFVIDRLYMSEDTQLIKIPYKLASQSNTYSRSGMLTITLIGSPDYGITPFGTISDYYDFSYDETWVGSSTLTNINNITGEPFEPQFELVAPTINNSYITLQTNYPVNPPDEYKDNFVLEYRIDVMN